MSGGAIHFRQLSEGANLLRQLSEGAILLRQLSEGAIILRQLSEGAILLPYALLVTHQPYPFSPFSFVLLVPQPSCKHHTRPVSTTPVLYLSLLARRSIY